MPMACEQGAQPLSADTKSSIDNPQARQRLVGHDGERVAIANGETGVHNRWPGQPQGKNQKDKML